MVAALEESIFCSPDRDIAYREWQRGSSSLLRANITIEANFQTQMQVQEANDAKMLRLRVLKLNVRRGDNLKKICSESMPRRAIQNRNQTNSKVG